MQTHSWLKRVFAVTALVMFLIAIVPPATNAAPPKDGAVVYYVQFGDTLYSISKRFGTTVPAIQAANGLTSDYIYVGERLVIPTGNTGLTPTPTPSVTSSVPTAPAPSATIGPTGTPNPAYACKYTVQPRDTLYSIAYRYNKTSLVGLMQANYLYTPYIVVGQQLNVPCLTPAPAPFPTYTVVKGDNLFRIALRFQTSIYAIAIVNGIPNPNLIFAGQTLVIPYPNSRPGTPIPPGSTPGAGATATVTSTPITTTAVPGGACSANCSIVLRNLAYEPRTLTVTKGTTVTWLNIDTVAHTVTSGNVGQPNGIFRSPQLGSSQNYTFKFDNAGTFPYYCEVHGAQMTGTIIVQ